MMNNNNYGRRQHDLTTTGQVQRNLGSLDESFSPANLMNIHHGHNMAPTFPSDNMTWANGIGLPDDDDPLLQHRLQQLVEHHKPSTSRNVLRELADVAEQQSTPSGNKRKGFDDDAFFEDGEDDDGRKLPPRKQSKSSPNGSISRARSQMNEVLSNCTTLRHSIWLLEGQRAEIADQLANDKAALIDVEHLVQVTSEELVNELLEDDTPWNQMYFHLVDFRNRNGHLRVPWKKGGLEKDPITARLGPWLVQQRKDYRRDRQDPERLEPYKIIALEKLNIEWDPFQQQWLSRLEDLKRFQQEFGHCRVPYCIGKLQRKSNKDRAAAANQEDLDEEHGRDKVKYDSLGVWVKRQRQQYKNFMAGNKEKAGEMSDERIALLNSIGFDWCLRNDNVHKSWSDYYNEVRAFKDEFGHTRIDERLNKPLSDWINRMRVHLKKYSELGDGNVLSPEQFALIGNLDLDLSLREQKFETRFSELMDFHKLHGHCLVPTAYAVNQKLSNWVQTQRRQYKLMKEGKKSQMTEEKMRLLSDAGFEFEVTKQRKSEASQQMEKSWDEFFAELQQCRTKYGNVNHTSHRKGKALRNWCDEQHVQHTLMKWGKPCTITEAQIDALTQIGLSWSCADTPSKGWDDYYCDLLSFYIKNSTFDIPDQELGLKNWVETQQIEYTKYVNDIPSYLTKGQIKRLNDISFPLHSGSANSKAKVPTKRSWEEMCGQLLEFKCRHNNFSVPSGMKELHAWTCQQRQQEKNIRSTRKLASKCSAIWEERLRRLSEVGFDWDGELPKKSSAPTKSLRSDDDLDDKGLASRGLNYNTDVMNNNGIIIPVWTSGGTMTSYASVLSNPMTGQFHMPPQDIFHSDAKTSSKFLADQAAQIVADVNNRTIDDI